MQLQDRELQFLARLGKSAEGLHLLGLIQAEIAEVNGNLRKLTGESLYREQGKAQWLDEFVRRLETDATAQRIARRPTPIAAAA
jgi:hypothetical protein